MDNEKTEVKKIKTQIIPAIHNTVSLQFYLRTEDGKPIANEEVVYNLLRETGEISNSYRQITNEEGKVHLTLNLKGDTIIQLLYEGSDKYEKAKVNT